MNERHTVFTSPTPDLLGERRASPRVSATCTVVCRNSTGQFVATLLDLSGQGLQANAVSSVKVGSSWNLLFTLPGKSIPQELMAVVVRSGFEEGPSTQEWSAKPTGQAVSGARPRTRLAFRFAARSRAEADQLERSIRSLDLSLPDA